MSDLTRCPNCGSPIVFRFPTVAVCEDDCEIPLPGRRVGCLLAALLVAALLAAALAD